MYKLLVLDLDGTLLDSTGQISPENIRSLARAHAKGLKVILATGRPAVGTVQVRQALGLVAGEYLIVYNGALTLDLQTGQPVSRHPLFLADYCKIAGFAQSFALQYYCFDQDTCLASELHPVARWEGEVNGIEVRQTDFGLFAADWPLMKVMASGDPSALDAAAAAMPAWLAEQYTIVRSAPVLLEFLNRKASKGQAVQALAGLLGITREEIICIGDSGNDIDMIRYAGLGVAMGNGTAGAKAAAGYITSDNDRHGVAEVVDRFIL